ncbi:proteasome subunit beta [Pseudomonas syringae]|uniref:proteasome subunit beta n=1 Tax=Pseudomonas syringae TaxID=317 RepID=UPI001F0D18BE|nr:proteasome subunit beta [Pseudomonas syringae]MCH5583127.1 proteasome subunit beta [Pseudomonas syringae pv. syringae]MCH5592774.1 proteasome subunit beta [Pseudomonas syringae pv. syringae]MDF5791025.1 proteasome subunit beta [Pseudomonas syringae pv. syringae]
MTTIAYKDGVIAYDSRITNGAFIDTDDYEKCLERDGVQFVLTRATADFPRLIESFFGARHKNVDCSALAFDGQTIWCMGHNNRDRFWKTAISPGIAHAMGSGMPHAFTAMDMGATAAEAVEMAKKRDTGTGGRVRTLQIAAGNAS